MSTELGALDSILWNWKGSIARPTNSHDSDTTVKNFNFKFNGHDA